jgi:uncharacterized glyoxalase superfamily protein PhnB
MVMTVAPVAIANVFPCLRYVDAIKAIDWLRQAFGFETLMVVPCEDGSIVHAELRVGSGVIMLGSSKDDVLHVKSPKEIGLSTHCVYIYVEEVDSHFERATSAGAEVVYGLADTHYGSREYCVRDFEGHVWCFGTYLPKI